MKKKNLLLTAVAMLGLTAATMAQNVPNYVPTNGLIGWWPFSGNANDESGNGNNGTVNGATLTTDRFGNMNKAFSFNGATNYIIMTGMPTNYSSYTYSAWVKSAINQQPGGTGIVVQSGFNGSQIGSFGLSCNGNTPNGRHRLANYNLLGAPAVNGFDLNWHLNTFTWDGSQIKFYIDGILQSTVAAANTSTIYNELVVGALRFGTSISYHFNGRVDDIGIWNRALNQQEITTLYNAVNCAQNTSITPQSNNITTGSTATFTATTTDPNPSYIWQSDFGQGFQTLNNFGNYSGVNTGTLNIANIQLPNHTQPIRVITTSDNCVDTSNVAVINILDSCLVTVYDTVLTTVTDTLIINAQISGINPPNNSNTIKVFPNPASTHITIDYGNFALMNGYQLRIENSLGQQVFQTNIVQQSDYLNLSTWGGNGLYFVHIIDTQGNTIDIRKIVLQ